MDMKKIVTIAVLVLLVLMYYKSRQPISLGHGVKAAEDPVQIEITKAHSFSFNEFEITPLAEFGIKAKVILKEDYSMDRESDISPTDLALGWGRMSDESVLEQIEFSQSGRWYRYRYKSPPIPQQEIQTHSANMHLIPANDFIAKQIKGVKAGQVIKIDGKLVKVFNPKTRLKWQSSLTRNDTGGGACELIYVERLEILEG